jgi:predicted dehydrogenase
MSKQVLVVGCGSIGERHLRCLLKTGRTQVTACETNSGLLARMKLEYRVAGFASLDEALSSQKFDGVVICTPAHTHVGLALIALRSGAGLLIEKPLSVNLERVDELKQEIARAGRFVGVAYVYHFMPAIQQAREVLRTGDLGQPLQVSVVTGQHFPTFRPAYRDIYYARHETGGGAIQDALTHLANAVEWLVGPTNRIACEAKHQALEGVTVEDTVSAAARNNDVLVSYSLNQFQAPNEISIQIHCERSSLKMELHEQRWAVFPRGAAGWDYHPAPVTHRDDLFVAQANAFLDGLDGNPNELCTFEEAIQTLKFNLAALQSARTGQTVTLA